MYNGISKDLIEQLAIKLRAECEEFEQNTLQLSKQTIYNKCWKICFVDEWLATVDDIDVMCLYIQNIEDITSETIQKILNEKEIIMQLYNRFCNYYVTRAINRESVLDTLCDYIKEYEF